MNLRVESPSDFCYNGQAGAGWCGCLLIGEESLIRGIQYVDTRSKALRSKISEIIA